MKLFEVFDPEEAVGQKEKQEEPIPTIINIEKETINNNELRKVIVTTDNSQLILMSVDPGEELGHEVHNDADQFFRIESGQCVFEFGKEKDRIVDVYEGMSVLVPAGLWHNLKVPDTVDRPCKFYTLYSPPTHKTIKIDNKEIDIDDHNK